MRALLRAAFVASLVFLHLAVLAPRWLALLFRGAPAEERRRLLGQSLANLLRQLGATFVKVAQFLSTRADLLPSEVLAALEELQDRVGPFPYHHVQGLLREELGSPPEVLFLELDPYPVASASVSQVHRAVLRGGRAVAVKVLRPGIERRVEVDLGILRCLARLAALLPPLRPFDPVRIVEELGRAVRAQLDLRLEAENNRTFARNFAGDPSVAVPELCPELSTRRVLCMELVPGVKLLGPLWDPARAEAMARKGFHLLLRMIFEHGFIHADLHPGNILVDGERLVLVDLGLVARLEVAQVEGLAALFSAWASRDPARVLEASSLFFGAAREEVSRPELVGELSRFFERFRAVRLSEVGLGKVLLEMTGVLRRHGLGPDPTLAMVLVAISVVEGVGRRLAPSLDLVQESLAFFARRPRSGDGVA